MSILIEALSLVIPRRVLDAAYPGGTDAYLRDALAADIQFRYAVADDRLTVMSFFEPDAAEPWASRLLSYGIASPEGNGRPMVFVDQRFGPTMPCDWLEWRRHEDGFTYAWLAGTEPGDMMAPDWWTAEQSRGLVRHDIRDEPGRMMQLAEENGIETWLDFTTGAVTSSLAHRESAPTETRSRTTATDEASSEVDDASASADAPAPLLPIVTRAFDKRRLRYAPLSEHCVVLPIGTRCATYDCRVVVDERLRTVTCYAGFGTRVAEARRSAVAEAIARVNCGLLLGCFELDWEDGDLHARVGTRVESGELTIPMFDAMMASLLSIADSYHEALMRVIYAGTDPGEAIAEVEGE